jgi:hypothetical protein
MEHSHATTCRSHGWLDHLAIGMASVCAVHCLLTPILVIALPIVATSFFVHEDFHLWMILFVLPTTGFAVFMGCRKHKDKWVGALSVLGLSILIFALVQERMHHAAHADLSKEAIPMHAGAWFNTLGGLLLASAHIRNFRLCRKSHCSH